MSEQLQLVPCVLTSSAMPPLMPPMASNARRNLAQPRANVQACTGLCVWYDTPTGMGPLYEIKPNLMASWQQPVGLTCPSAGQYGMRLVEEREGWGMGPARTSRARHSDWGPER